MDILVNKWTGILATVILLSCCTLPPKKTVNSKTADDNIFVFDSYGLLCSMESNMSSARLCALYETKEGFRRRINTVLDVKSERDKTARKVLLFAHGGLNGRKTSLSNSRLKFEYLEARPSEFTAVPIFLTWPSGFPSSYYDHLFSVREGRQTPTFLGFISSPVVFVSDVLKTLGNFPKSIYYQIVNQKDLLSSDQVSSSGDFRSLKSFASNSWRESQLRFCRLGAGDQIMLRTKDEGFCGYGTVALENTPRVRWSSHQQGYENSKEQLKAVGQKSLFPFRSVTGVVFHSELATASWDIMKRRAQNLSAPVTSFDNRLCSMNLNCLDTVRASDLYMALLNKVDRGNLSLAGHSMGAIVLNKLLSEKIQYAAEIGTISDISYFASADTIENTLNVTEPLVRNASSRVDVYNHTLNRVAELLEYSAYGLMPSGTLLAHIDQLYENPIHPMQRVQGSELNTLSSLSAIVDRIKGIENHYHFLGWDSIPGCRPRTHGDLGNPVFLLERNRKFSTSRDKCP